MSYYTRGMLPTSRSYPTPPRSATASRRISRRAGVVGALLGTAGAVGSHIYSLRRRKNATRDARSSRRLFKSSKRKRKRTGRVARSGRKVYRSKGAKSFRRTVKKIAGTSYSWTKEYGFAQTDNTCLNIGHCNMPPRKILYTLNGAFVRLLLEKLSILPQAANEAISYLTVGDVFIVYYSTSWNTNVISNYAITLAAVGQSVVTLTAALSSAMYTALAADTTNAQFHIKSIAFEPAAASKLSTLIIAMAGVTATYTAVSSLKIQNRTDESTVSNDALTVDTVPIHGRMYYGNGSGTENRYAAAASNNSDWVCGQETGVYNIAGGADDGFQEPPPVSCLPQVKGTKPIHINAGEIKTSVLFSTVKVKLSDLFQKLPFSTTTTDYVKSPYGKFCMISLEKVLEYENDKASRKNMSIKCELETKMTCHLSYNEQHYLAPEVDVS